MSDEFLDRILELTTSGDQKRVLPQHSPSTRAMLLVLVGTGRGERAWLDDGRFVFGRALSADMHLDSEAVSRVHAYIEVRGGRHVLVDNASTNGSYVNYRPATETPLVDGDQIQIGQWMFKYLAGENIDSSHHSEFERLAHRDALTSALNRPAFEGEIVRVLAGSEGGNGRISLILFDVDDFELLIETHGRTAGDLVLSFVAEKVHQIISSSHQFARVGGDEFAIICMSGLDAARGMAEVIRGELNLLDIIYDGAPIKITVSMGVAEYNRDLHRLPEALFQSVDALLYRAIEQGKNCVIG